MNRLFTKSERNALRLAASDHCEECGTVLDKSFHADHIIAHANGGATDINNGQALCAPCNLAKSAKTVQPRQRKPLPPLPGNPVNLRQWQKNLADQMVNYTGNALSLCASVGAGKTLAMATIWRDVIAKRHSRPLLVICVPRRNLVNGWMRAAALCGLTFDDGLAIDTAKAAEVGAVHGVVMTYAAIAGSGGEALAALCARFDVTLVRDETQWISDANSWGDRFIDAARNAAFHAGLTGTPFRSVEDETLWGWDGENALRFDYTYHDALADGVCPAVDYSAFGGNIRWEKDNKGTIVPMASRFGEDEEVRDDGRLVNEPLVNARLRYANWASPAMISPFLRDMMFEADQHLANVRKSQTNAGGIVFCASIPAANAVAQMVRGWGRSVIVVHSGMASPSQIIEDFANGDDEWLISVDMVKEGTDIPRLRTAVLAGVTVTARQVIQMVGRLLRLWEFLPPSAQPCRVFMPMDPRLVQIMARFGDDVGKRRKGGKGGGGGGGQDYPVLVRVTADGVAVELEGRVGDRAPDEKPSPVDEALRGLFDACGFGVEFGSMTGQQHAALFQAKGAVDAIGAAAVGAMSRADYVKARDKIARRLAGMTGLPRGGCAVLVDRMMRPWANPARLGALPVGGKS